MKVMGVVFSNLHDKDIPELTANRTLASVPFAGRYRLVDFVLSSMVNSGVEKVGIITKSNYQSLMDHVGSGKQWDLARKNSGLMILPPFGASDSKQLYSNRLEALLGIVSFLERSNEEYVVMSDCDTVANVNYADAIEFHKENDADVTLLYRIKNVVPSQKTREILEVDEAGRVKKFMRTEKASGDVPVFSNQMIMRRERLLRLLEQAARDGLKSFSKDIMQKQADTMRIFAYKYTGYYASIDDLANYFRHTLEMLDSSNRRSLFRKDSPIFTKVRDSAPTVIAGPAAVSNSIIADGCRIEGTVKNSVLFRGVHVAKRAVVENSILMQDTYVSEGTSLNCVIADKNVVIRERRTLSGCEQRPYYIAKNTSL